MNRVGERLTTLPSALRMRQSTEAVNVVSSCSEPVAECDGTVPQSGEGGARFRPARVFGPNESAVRSDWLLNACPAVVARPLEFGAEGRSEALSQRGDLSLHFRLRFPAARRNHQEAEGGDDAGEKNAGDVGGRR